MQWTKLTRRTPIESIPYHAGPKIFEFKKAEIEKMLHMDVIEPAQSESASSIVFSPKEDVSQCFCIEYRKLNVVNFKGAYKLPRMVERLESFIKALIFPKLDANSGSW